VPSEAFATLELSQHLLNLITEFPALISLDEVPIASNPVWLKEWARMEFWGMLPTSSQSTSLVWLALEPLASSKQPGVFLFRRPNAWSDAQAIFCRRHHHQPSRPPNDYVGLQISS
jgi:hypothetical protein